MASTIAIHGIAHRYCLRIPNGTTLDLQGSTLLLAPAQNAALLINDGAGTTYDRDIEVCNGVLDGNKDAQGTPESGEMACLFLWGVTQARVHHLQVRGARQYAGRFLACADSLFDDLDCKESDGDGWSFGIAARNQVVRRSRIDRVRAANCRNLAIGSLQGNPAILCVHHCQIGSISAVNCGGGIKIQDGSRESDFQDLKFVAGSNSTANSGIKVQGRAGLVVSGLRIRSITSHGVGTGTGLYTYACSDIVIDNYAGIGSGKSGSAPDCDLRGRNITIHQLSSSGAEHVAVLIAADGHVDTAIKIGVARISDVNGNAIQIAMNGGVAHIGSATITSGRHKKRRGRALRVTGRGTTGACELLKLTDPQGGQRPPLFISPDSPGFVIHSAALHGDPTDGHVRFAKGQSIVVVENRCAFRLPVSTRGAELSPEVRLDTSEVPQDAGTYAVRVRRFEEGSGFEVTRAGQLDATMLPYRIGRWSIRQPASHQ
jgi:hypothetical protein